MTTTQPDPATLYTVAADALQHKERSDRPTDYQTWQDALARRATLANSVQQFEQIAADMRRRLNALPALARPDLVLWAQAVRELPNLAFLEVDTDGLSADADILRLVLVNQTGAVLYNQLVQPRRPLSSKIAHLIGITSQMLEHAPSLAKVWRSFEFARAFVGRYILSFNLEFDLSKLTKSAARYDLPPCLLWETVSCFALRSTMGPHITPS